MRDRLKNRIIICLTIAAMFFCSPIVVFAEDETAEDAVDAETAEDAAEDEARIILGESNISEGNRVWFYDMAGGTFDSDFVIVESLGHWGLIDTGNRYENCIEDANGIIYDAKRSQALSNQATGKNGRDAAIWMIETLGVSHLDFIIGTHSHSDHIGGVPEIAALSFYDEEGEKHSLVDENTVYFYKAYQHIDSLNDDLGTEKRSGSWHNQAFNYQALKSMTDRGANVVEASQGNITSESLQPILYYSEELSQIEESGILTGAYYEQGSPDDWFDDYISFDFGDYNISLYNLFSVGGALNENVNSIAAVITDGNRTLYTAGDINVEQEIEQKVARSIESRFGKIDVIKASHHGYNKSNSKELLDLFQPSSAFVTSYSLITEGLYSGNLNQSFFYYGRSKYGTDYYMVGPADKALVYDFGDGEILEASGEQKDLLLSSADSCINNTSFTGGWTEWIQSVDENGIQSEYYYFSNGEPKGGWIARRGGWYYFGHDDGLLQRGWIEEDGSTYYLSPERTDKFHDGQMVTGEIEIDDNLYFFRNNGAMLKGWRRDGEAWYYHDDDGCAVTGWKRIDHKWYYFGTEDTHLILRDG